jgi:hypothetical protein
MFKEQHATGLVSSASYASLADVLAASLYSQTLL